MMIKKIILLIILFVGYIYTVANAEVTIPSLPWSTTYNCPEWNSTSTTPGTTTGCDNTETPGPQATIAGNYEQITTAANYSGGAGGRGQRHWIGGGVTGFGCGDQDNSGGIIIRFPSDQTQVWVRMYVRFQTGFTWASYDEFKMMYLSPGFGHFATAIETYDTGSTFSIYTNSGDQAWHGTTNYGFAELWGDPSLGAWHVLEVFLKKETSGPNGIIRIWTDGILRANDTTVTYGGTLSWIELPSNSKTYPCGDPDRYVDFDDVSITNTTPANRDAGNNPMIGPIGWGSVYYPPISTPAVFRVIP